jgi:hypothetical protein
MPDQVTTVTWKPYPENKPIPEGNEWKVFLTTSRQGNKLFTNRNTYFYKDEQWEYDENDFPVIAFAELPAPYDPAAKTFNFLTAVARMKAGKVCKSLDSETEYIVTDDELFANYDITDDRYCLTLTLSEIEGQWSEVE